MKQHLRRSLVYVIVIILTFTFGSPFTYSVNAATEFTDGDVFVAVSNGQIQWYHSGTLFKTLQTGLGGFTTGMAFDTKNNLYVTDFTAAAVSKFDKYGNLLGTFGSGYNSSPESIVFDKDGFAYFGHADGARAIRKYDTSGNFVDSFQVQTEDRGSDWIDLADDNCTMYYTSEDYHVKRYDVCKKAQLPDFTPNPLPNRPAYALRILSTGGVMVADTANIVRLDVNGNVMQTYDASGEDCWFALNLDPDAKSFWSADFCTADVYKFDLATGIGKKMFNTGTGSMTVFGLTVKGEITAAQPCALPAFADTTNGNPIYQLSNDFHKTPYGGMEIVIPGKGVTFLPYNYGKTSIADEGCYLISGTMVINYYAALQNSPFRTNPIILNDWISHNITNKNSGYLSGDPLDDSGHVNYVNPTHVANAGVQPTTLIQYAKAKNININLDGNVRTDGRNEINDKAINATVCSLNPVIVDVNNNGHFVVITGKTKVNDVDTWRLHDPLKLAPTTLYTDYQNQYGNRVVLFKGVDPLANRSRFLLALYSPAEIVVTDPQGRRTGLDPRNGTSYSEIPLSSYGIEYLASDEGLVHLTSYKIMDIETPLDGTYIVDVIGTGEGTIGMSVIPVDVNGDGQQTIIADTVSNNMVNTYQLSYSSIPGQPSQFIRPVTINIKPGANPAPINLNSNGVIPVAILSTTNFDATNVDPLSVKFGPGQSTSSNNSFEDVNGDGKLDLVLHFPASQSGIMKTDKTACITGKTNYQLDIQGCGSVIIVP